MADHREHPQTSAAVVDHFFRHEAGKMTAALTRAFGLKDLALAEDIVQDTLLKALEYWQYHPLPDNPKAWLFRAARNRALDVLRKQRPDSLDTNARRIVDPEARVDEVLLHGLQDSQLRMMFACCTPQLAPEVQVMLILKVLCGFGVRAIARAFLQQEEAIAKRLYRARRQLAESGFDLDLPAEALTAGRHQQVLLALYLLFNEGYNSTEAPDFLQKELAAEAIRLVQLLHDHPATASPEAHALLALMYFHAARFPARRDALGQMVLLEDQDRTRWDRDLIAAGIAHFGQAMQGDTRSVYHYEAAIAEAHTTAATYSATPWHELLGFYDSLKALKPTPIVALNRAVVVSKVHGPSPAIALVEALPGYERHHRFLSVLAHLYQELGHTLQAATHWQRALALCPSPSEKAWIAGRLEKIGHGMTKTHPSP